MKSLRDHIVDNTHSASGMRKKRRRDREPLASAARCA